ncbi:MAG: fasciclin domain-containing protein [Gemmatimonadota bacterium]
MPASAQYGSQAEANSDNIVEVAVEAGTFQTLVAAIQAAGLVETLSGEGPFTVFAPTDEAFAQLPEGTIEALLADVDALREILTYHVVPGRVTAAQVVQLDEATTVQGGTVSISTSGDTVRINDARVVTADIEASNGIIHVIDAVILPAN